MEKFMLESQNNLNEKLISAYKTTAYYEDYEKFEDYIEKLRELKNSYFNSTDKIDIKTYVTNFWQLYRDRTPWLEKHNITINVPQLVHLEDFNIENLKETEQEFIYALSNNINPESSLFLKFKNYMLTCPYKDLELNRYKILKSLYKIMFIDV